MESAVRVDPVGLEWLAATCTSLADEIKDAAPSTTTGPECQTTSNAVAAVHSDVAAIRTMLYERMGSTAAKLSASASAYTAGDDNSAADIAAAGATLET